MKTLTLAQYFAALEIVGRLWASHGCPSPLPDGPTRDAWATLPYSLTGALIPVSFGYCPCGACL